MSRFSLNTSRKTKTTPAGELPVDWGCVRFREIVKDAEYGLSSPTDPDGNVPILKMNSISDGKLSVGELDRVTCTEEEIERYSIRRGDILFNRTNSLALVGKTAVVEADARIVFASYLVRFRLAEVVESRFVGYWFNFSRVERRLKELATVGVSQSNINPTRLQHDLHVPIPPLSEQRHISDLLGTWDDALESLDALVVAKERRKTALMQQLLTGRRRLRGFSGKWPKQRLGDLAEEVAIPNRGKLGTERLYAVTKADGMVPMREHVKGASLQRCNVVERDCFAYNPMRINIGSLARWHGPDPVMVSPDHVVFRCNSTALVPGFLDHLRRTWRWQQFVGVAGDGSVRVRIYFDRLAEFAFPCPPPAEQQAIATILDSCDEELRLLRAQRAALDQQKHGLMQRLLTGRVRLSV